jgi:hypothetical protein
MQRIDNSLSKLLGSHLAPAAGYTVKVVERGAVVASTSTGTTATVHAGHTFEAGDRVLKNVDTAAYRIVDSVTETTVVFTEALSVATGDTLTNLGNDTGANGPTFDGDGATIYSDPGGVSAISGGDLTTDSDGEYGYHLPDGVVVWEIILYSGTPLQIVRDVGGKIAGPTSSTDNTLPRFDGTGGGTLQGSGVTVGDSNNVSGVVNLTATGTVQAATGTVTGNATVGGTLGVTGALTASAAATVGTTLGVTGAATFSSRVEATQLRLTTGSQPTEKTIASGAITLSSAASFLQDDTEGDAASDDLDTITTVGGEWAGTILVLRAAHDDRTVVVKNGTGNIFLNGSDATLDNTLDALVLFDNGASWVELCRAVSNGS